MLLQNVWGFVVQKLLQNVIKFIVHFRVMCSVWVGFFWGFVCRLFFFKVQSVSLLLASSEAWQRMVNVLPCPYHS